MDLGTRELDEETGEVLCKLGRKSRGGEPGFRERVVWRVAGTEPRCAVFFARGLQMLSKWACRAVSVADRLCIAGGNLPCNVEIQASYLPRYNAESLGALGVRG